jgi:hypothetical protein
MALPSLRRQKGKLRPHMRSHATGGRFRMNGHVKPFVDDLARQAKCLEKALRDERRTVRKV